MNAEDTRQLILTKLQQSDPEVAAMAEAVVKEVSDDQLVQIKEMLIATQTEVDALRLLGRAAGPGAIGTDLLEAGRQLFTRQKFKISKAVCGSPVIRAYCTRRSAIDSTTAATVVAGVLIQHQLGGVNVIALTAVVLRAGLSEFCHAEWSK